jgi:hypothetical protein
MVFHTVHRTGAARDKIQPRQNKEHNSAQDWRNLHRCESGQTITVWLGAIVVMSSVLMGSAYDMSVAWMHKQWADTAAQAACTAGAMDMLWAANAGGNSTPLTAYNFIPAPNGTASGDCATSSSTSMCYYAKLNGYASPGLTGNVPSNDVSWSLSASAPLNSNSPTLTTTPSNGVPAYMNVVVNENVPVTFMGIFAHFLGMKNSWSTIQVAGHCNCGLEGTTTTSTTTDSLGMTFASCQQVGSGSCTNTSGILSAPSNTVTSGALVTISVAYSYTGGGGSIGGGSGIGYISCNGGTSWTGFVGRTITLPSSGNGTGSVSCTGITNTNVIRLKAYVQMSSGYGNDNYGSFGFTSATLSFSNGSTTLLHVTNFQND